MRIKEQTRKLAVGCSKHCFEVVDEADVVWRDFRRVWPACKLVFVLFSQSHQPVNRLFYFLSPKPWKRLSFV